MTFIKIKNKIRSFSRLPFKQKIFFFSNFFLCGIARASINLFPLRFLAPYFGQFYKTTTMSTIISNEQINQAKIIGKSVKLAAKYTPWNSSCLTQAMVAKFWCKYYKIPYVFYIGFAKSHIEPSGYKAHAWITAGPLAITGGNGFLEYQVISSYIDL
jgi:hypothetical protein